MRVTRSRHRFKINGVTFQQTCHLMDVDVVFVCGVIVAVICRKTITLRLSDQIPEDTEKFSER